jgi:hypothetical protein
MLATLSQSLSAMQLASTHPMELDLTWDLLGGFDNRKHVLPVRV